MTRTNSRQSRPAFRASAPKASRRLRPFVGLERLEERQLLATLVVNSTLDNDSRDRFLTLREAILVAEGTLASASLTADERAQIGGTPTASSADNIGFNLPADDPGHVYYRNDGVAGHVSPALVTATTAADDAGIAAVAEEGLGPVEELLLPLADLDGVELIELGQFGDGSSLLGGLQRDLGLEGGRMAFAWTGHEGPRDGSEMFDQYHIPSCPGNGVHLIHQLGGLRRVELLHRLDQFSSTRSPIDHCYIG